MKLMHLTRGLLALAALAALLAGAPAALWAVGHPFLPTRIPTLNDITTVLVRPDNGTLLIGLLVAAGWAVWATLAASIIGEIIDRARTGGRTHHPTPSAVWPSRAVAALLIGWIVTAFATSPAAATAPATTAAASDILPRASDPSRPSGDPAGHGRVHVVAPRDTLWDIAAAELGDPLRWREILDLNRSRPQADGGRLSDDTPLHVGWTLTLPDNPEPRTDRVEVHPGDTLSALAGRYLGDPARYPELYASNTGRAQPDGHLLDDPDLIRPGWLLRLPDTTTHAAPETGTPPDTTVRPGPGPGPGTGTTTSPPPPAPTSATPTTPQPGLGPDVPPDAAVTPSRPTLSPAPAPAPRPTPSAPLTATSPPVLTPPATAAGSARMPAPATPSTESSAPAPLTTAASGSAHTADVDLPGPVFLGTAGTLASGLLAGLLVLRRRQLRWRRHGRRIALPGAALSQVEAGISGAAQPAGPLFLDLALRSLTLTTPSHFPELRAARLAPTGVDLVLTEPQQPPPPYLDASNDSDRDGEDGDSDGGTVWRAPADAQLPLTEASAVGVANPYPALASLGRRGDGTTFLVDLEHTGALHLTGDPDRAIALLRHIAVELGTARWADAITVLTVGLDPDLTGLPPQRVRQVPDLATALTQVRSAMTSTDEHLRHADGTSLLDLRVRDQLNEAWLVTVLLIAHTHELDTPDYDTAGSSSDEPDVADLATLCTDLASGGRRAAAVVTAGFPTRFDGVQVDIDHDGTTTGLGPDAAELQVEQLTTPLARDVLAIIGIATAPDQPVPPAEHPEPWADRMGEDGTVRDLPTTDPPADTPQPDSPQSQDPHSGAFAATAADEQQPVRDIPAPRHETPAALPPTDNSDPVAARRLLLIEQQDPHLDDDLASWHTDTTPPRPLVAILGPPTLRAPGTPPEKRYSWFLEVVIYLALHPHGVDRDKLMTDLWPDGSAIQPATIRRAIAEARAWTGRDTTTNPPTEFIPAISPAGGDRYRITGHLTDWDLFRRLRKRAQARTNADQMTGAVADYIAALALVRGPVLHPLRSRGYAWLHNPDQRHADLIPGYLIDTAHELVDLSLGTGDLDTARSAAATAQTVDPDRTSDRPFTDLMRIAHAAGDLDEMRTHAELLLAERDFEVGEDLPPESFAVFNELFPHGLRARAS